MFYRMEALIAALWFVLLVSFDGYHAASSSPRYPVASTAPLHRHSPSREDSRLLLSPAIVAAIAGAVSCSSTHSLMVPLDVVKTKIQAGAIASGVSTRTAFRDIFMGGGIRALFTGITPTAMAYFLQGWCKFGLYQKFKTSCANISDLRELAERKLSFPTLLGCSGAAEVVASIVMCPLEVTKLHIVLHPTASNLGTLTAMASIWNKSGLLGFYSGLPWILLRQLPYTCMKLATYDAVSAALHRLSTHFPDKVNGGTYEDNKDTKNGKPARIRKEIVTRDGFLNSRVTARIEAAVVGAGDGMRSQATVRIESLLRSKRFMQLVSGVIAGLAAALISQPADVILSKVSSSSNAVGCAAGSVASTCVVINGPLELLVAVQQMGFSGSFRGIRQRAVMVGSMTAMQFVVYEQMTDWIRNWEARFTGSNSSSSRSLSPSRFSAPSPRRGVLQANNAKGRINTNANTNCSR